VKEGTNLASMPLAGEFNVPPHVELVGIKQPGKFACVTNVSGVLVK